MDDYKRVEEALASGAEPEMLCATCPWDRFCVQPPSMTKEDVDREQEKSKQKAEEDRRKAEAEGKNAPLPMGMILTSLMYAGSERKGALCPVFAIRLRSADGRELADHMKNYMRESSA